MKKTVKRIISLVLVMLMLPCIELFGLVDFSPLFEVKASASEYYTNGYCGEITETNDGTNLEWTIDDEGTLTVTGTGRMRAEAFVYDLRIKSVVIGEGVENIGAYAFQDCTNLVTINFSDTVTHIDDNAFYRCSALTDIEFPDSLKSIGQAAFYGCDSFISIQLNDSLESIGKQCFFSCDKLTSVTFPDSLKVIEEYMFFGCYNLATVNLPDNLETIKADAFYACYKLKNIDFPSALLTIGTYAFYDSGLETVSIPDSVTTIASCAFCKNENLKVFNIGSGLNVFFTNNFEDCFSLEEINVSEDNNSYSSVDGVLYNKSKNSIVKVPLAKSGEITIPATVSSFTYNAVSDCTKLTAINVETGNEKYQSIDGIVYSADGKTLIRCPEGRVDAVEIADGTETISDYAFYNCNNITNIKLTDSVVTIKKSAFMYCRALETVKLSDSLKTIDNHAFYGCGKLTSVDFPDTLLSIGSAAFSSCDLLSVVIPDSVISLDGFSANPNLKNVYIGSGVESIKNNTFDCSSLEEIVVSEDNQYYTSFDGILYNKTKTKVIQIPRGILGEITLPATLEEFTYDEVRYCPYIDSINVEQGSEFYKSIDGILYSADGKSLIRCPEGRVNDVIIAEGTEKIEYGAFYYCGKFSFADIPDSVITIGNNAFYECRLLSTVNISSRLQTIGSHAFYYCHKLKSVTLPETLVKIDAEAFECCYSLEEINFPSALTVINNKILDSTGFKEIVFPETIQSFDHLHMSYLKTLTLENKYCEYTATEAPKVASGCTIRAYCGSPGHTLAVKRLLNFESIGHTFLDWYTVTPATYESEGVERRDCAYCDGYEERNIPMIQKDTYTATFVANGEIVATVDFAKGTTEIDEPVVPAKDRYLGEWEEYTLTDSNITINAVYTLIKSSDASEIEADSTVIHYTGKDDILFKLSASADATVVKSTISNSVPLDIILVVDQSGSMDETLGGRTKKVDALKETALEFVNSVYDNAKLTGCDHRISLVGFGLSGDYNGYEKNENTELLTTSRGIVNYTNITTADYASSLVSANVNGSVNVELVTAINNIGARGATAADLGFEMAKGIFANTDSTGRQRVVVFMTDGEPTYLSGFQTSVANSAIANAYTLKNAYDASVYSVGVFSSQQSSNSNINKFMNAVSSGYPSARSMTNMGSGNNGEFFTTVNNTDALSSVFKSISTESLSHTAPFDNITFVKTLSKYVTLTSQQEQSLRVDLMRKYEVTNDDIVITRNADGTTTIEIHSLVPEKVTDADGNVKYVVDVEFFASLNENAADADDYFVDTEDSGVMLSPDSKGYEVTFGTSAVTLSEKKTRVIFTINGEVYEISENVDSNGYAVAPEIELSEDWTFVSWKTSSQTATNGLVLDATLTKSERTIIWHTDSGDIVQTYVQGDFIVPPIVTHNVEGYAFLSWDRSVPTTMGDENLEFTAVYGQHVHNYTSGVTNAVTCENDGIRTYTCTCGDSYTEIIEAIGHNYEAITPSIEKDDSKCTFVCSNCGDKYEYALDYQVVTASGKRTQVLYEFSLTDDNLNTEMQPDGEIYIRIPLSEIHGNAKSVTVIRTNDDGTKTQVPAVIEEGFLVITCDHFTPYEVNFEIECDAHKDDNYDGWCDNCDISVKADIENTPEIPEQEITCEHICHSDNTFIGFIWKIVSFFCKLLGFNDKQICDCGIAHW